MIKHYRDILKRHDLKKVLPISTPFRLSMEISTYCNFNCPFCFHSLPKETLLKKGFTQEQMSLELFKEIANQLCGFEQKLKQLFLSLVGEPLTNPYISEMISSLKQKNVTESILITTNASLLDNKMSDSIIKAGIDEVIVSLYGLSARKYKELCGVDIDFDKYVDNLRYFYKNKGDSKLYIKTIDVSLDGFDSWKKFHEIFDPISDLAYIENIVELFDMVEYDKIKPDYEKGIIEGTLPYKDIRACPSIFHSLHILPNGNVIPCCVDYGQSIVYGNVKEQSIVDIWNGEKIKRLWIDHLDGNRWKYDVCGGCSQITHCVKPSDIIDDAAAEIKARIEGLSND